MTKAAEAFLGTLDPAQRAAATAPFDVEDHREWTYLPGPRPGMALAEMSDEQRAAALDLLETGCSPSGFQTARGIVELDEILRGPARAWQYWLRVLGRPGEAPWGWRIGGHHLGVHVTVVGDAIAVTPNFFGAEPAVVLDGPHRGLRTLPGEEEVARALLASLDPGRREIAVVDATAPADILTRHDPVADAGVLPAGLAYADMLGEQRDLLRRLIRVYVDRVVAEVGGSAWQEVEAGLPAVRFSWAGPDQPGQGHYYAVAGETFLLEYDNTQDNANHIHTVWRDLRHDWGEDLLAAHYAEAH